MDWPVFRSPEWLWLLLLAPLFFLRRRKTGGIRGAFILAARILVYALLVGALGEPAVRRSSDAVTTYFLLDHSGSIPEALRTQSLDIVRNAVRNKTHRQDRAGLIVFGDEAIVEESPTANFLVNQIYSVVGPSNTDISAAVRLALSTFPDDTQKRIVLFTDGNATKGDLPGAVERAAAAHCPIDVVPLKYRYPEEVLLDSLTLPRKVKRQEPFQIRSNVVSLGDNAGKLSLFCDGQLIAQRDVTLHPGDNVFLFSHTLQEPGFHLFEARIESPRDGIAENNLAQAYTIIEEESLVLVAAESEEDARPLADALREEGIALRVRLAGSLPQEPGEWQSYDAIIFAGLGAEHVSMAQMEMIESQVRDLGTGFMMIGGPRSFGAGGYLGTPIEKVLPVSLDVNQNQVLPNGGIVFILDHIHCIGDRWSKDICAGALGGLTPMDSFGLLIPSEHWEIPLQFAQDKPALRAKIDAANVGDVSGADGYLRQAREMFSKSKCSYRHVVLITDGVGGYGGVVPSHAAIDQLREAKITLSIVLIEPRGTAVAGELRAAAARGGGNFYIVQPHQRDRVPQIFIKESTIVKKGLYFEEPFTPAVKENSEILEGIAPPEIPPLLGYNVTSHRDPTEIPLVSPHGDAVLAHWHYGLGKTVAFTSDASRRWGARWIPWNQYKRFWTQAVRWCQRRTSASPYQLTLQRGKKENTCEAVLDAQSEAGDFVNFLSPSGTLVTPDLKAKPLAFEQIGPGRYRATFPTDTSGGYVVNVQYKEGGRPYLLRGGYVPPYQPEYRNFEDNEPLLLSIADQTGGRRVTPGLDLFARTSEITYTSKPIWPFLMLLAVCLFPLDIAIRRVVVRWQDLKTLYAALIPGRARARDPVQEALQGTRDEIRARFPWEPSRPGAEQVSAEKAAVSLVTTEASGPESSIAGRLMEAKKRAKKEFDKK
jgi:Ca-activated chloride channel family protein